MGPTPPPIMIVFSAIDRPPWGGTAAPKGTWFIGILTAQTVGCQNPPVRQAPRFPTYGSLPLRSPYAFSHLVRSNSFSDLETMEEPTISPVTFKHVRPMSRRASIPRIMHSRATAVPASTFRPTDSKTIRSMIAPARRERRRSR